MFSYKNVVFFLAVALKISVSYIATDANMLAEVIFKISFLTQGKCSIDRAFRKRIIR